MKAVLFVYLVIGAVDMIMGVMYFTSNQFMSYHSQANGAPWQEVGLGTQKIILALMKVAGGGWLALGFVTITLGLAGFVKGSVVARWTLPTATLIFYLVSFAATWEVYQETGAPTPWGYSLAIIGMALLALFIDAPWSSRVGVVKTDSSNSE